ncbi:hypothetical protein [Clostridium uliginosum]|uniref:FMN-binding domain-containing protein n=1 Tax=Clostridium uliginosum TaxID=119641 RepID=A0A1I1SRX6_9CLOT|nr:hypothetical protein [Clostridium uliginosum]SFD47508.1 hypothetical protein SAMN05421842_1555 [Clostridium uliginosum]
MKKLFILFLNLILVFNFISCNKSIYKDGIYIGTGDTYLNGSDDATITIDEGKIVDLTLRHLDKNKTEVNYKEWSGEEVNGITNPNLRKYRGDFIKKVLEQQNSEINIIDEIPEISTNWRLAVNRALEKAKK